MCHDTLRWFDIASDAHSRGLNMAPRRFPAPAEPSEDPLQEAKLAPKPCGNQCFVRFRWALEASRWLQNRLREARERPQRVPRGPQEGPKALKEPPKRAQ
eukprot:3836695-Pyramimonas_sp.AAC.1